MMKGNCVVVMGVLIEILGAVIEIIRLHWEAVSPPEWGRVSGKRSQ